MSVRVGQVLEVEILSFDPLGRGIAFVGDKAIVVPGVAVGDRVKVMITEVKGRIAKAQVVERL